MKYYFSLKAWNYNFFISYPENNIQDRDNKTVALLIVSIKQTLVKTRATFSLSFLWNVSENPHDKSISCIHVKKL